MGVALSDYQTLELLEGNKALVELLGLQSRGLARRTLTELTPPEYAERDAAYRRRLRTHGV